MIAAMTLENFERDNAFGESEVRLLTTVAASLGGALENARLFDETQRLLKETEQRNAELAVINSIQQGMAGSLDFRGIIELVGDKLRTVFGSDNLSILAGPAIRRGARALRGAARRARLSKAGQARSERAFMQALFCAHVGPCCRTAARRWRRRSLRPPEGMAPSLATLTVPIFASDKLSGLDHARQPRSRRGAFSEDDQRLLQTVAASLGVALENARLFDETQRLLKETEQRNAELAVINSIQQGMAGAGFRGIVELVGDKIAEIFRTKDMIISLYDRATNVMSTPYFLEHGDRFHIEPKAMGKGVTAHIIQTANSLRDRRQPGAAQPRARLDVHRRHGCRASERAPSACPFSSATKHAA